VALLKNAAQAEALAGWLNSTWIGAVARLSAVPASSGFARFNAHVVSRLPLTPSSLGDPLLSELARGARSGELVQEELDNLVAKHLGLSISAQRALRAALAFNSGNRR
jgi:hypothetical protein